MGWRTTFKKNVIAELKKIAGIGYVGSRWKIEKIELPSLIISLTTEPYERMMGQSIGVVRLEFEINGEVRDLDDPDEEKEDLLDSVIEKLEGLSLTDQTLVVDSTEFHDKEEGGGTKFTLIGYVTAAKDFSDM